MKAGHKRQLCALAWWWTQLWRIERRVEVVPGGVETALRVAVEKDDVYVVRIEIVAFFHLEKGEGKREEEERSKERERFTKKETEKKHRRDEGRKNRTRKALNQSVTVW